MNTFALNPVSPSKSSHYSKPHRIQTHHIQILRLKAAKSAPSRPNAYAFILVSCVWYLLIAKRMPEKSEN
jgi:hypothetical protein